MQCVLLPSFDFKIFFFDILILSALQNVGAIEEQALSLIISKKLQIFIKAWISFALCIFLAITET